MRIVGAGAGFGVILHAEERVRFVAHAFIGLIVQVYVRDFYIFGRERIRIHAKTVILRGDFYLLGEQIFYRVIGTVMAEFQLEGFPAQGKSAQLVPETNAEHRDAPDELANIFDGVADWFGIAGTVGKEDAIGAHAQDFFRRGLRGNDSHLAVMIHKQPQNVLLDAEIVGHHAEAARFAAGSRFAHVPRPRRGRQINRAGIPHVRLAAGYAAGEFLAGHAGQLLGFMNQLVRGSAVGRHHTAQRAEFADVAYQRARVDIPDDRNLVAIEIELRGFRGAPVGADLRKLAHDQRFDVRPARLFVLEIGANISNVRVGEADNLPGVTGVGENFLISGEASVKNDFAAAAHDGAGRAAVKDAPVFQRENGGSVRNFRQCVLPNSLADIVRSFCFRFGGRSGGERTEMVHRPIGKHGAPVDKPAGHRAEHAGIVGTDAVIAHDKIVVGRHTLGAEVAQVLILRRNIGLGERCAIDVDNSLANLHDFAGQADHALNERFAAVQRIPEDHYIAALDGLEAIDKFIDEDALLVGEQRRHAGTFDFYRLVEKNDDDQREADGDEQVARPNTYFVAQRMRGAGPRGRAINGGRNRVRAFRNR